MLGDTVETGSRSLMWNLALSDLEALIPDVPLRPLMGNHDAFFGGQYLFRKAFFPKNFSSDSGSPYYYSIDAGTAKIIVLDLPWGTEQFNRAQKEWLQKTLEKADPKLPIIVLSHSFFYASGYNDPTSDAPWYDNFQNIPAIAPLLERYGVDLVVSGHNHYEEYLEHNGVHYAVIGAMGGKSDPPPTYISPASKWMAVGTFGWLDVDITSSELVLSYRNENGKLLHEERIPYTGT
ncbi:Metallophosphoesterase (fragment) [uncultured spirochete]|uniref:Metallophosphoesterase n=1 Tax=uncultured spirochete TaxID=156406 RepID=A0A3P3XNE5_9SPIR